jgi:4'-phosphopantetheinyl transferase
MIGILDGGECHIWWADPRLAGEHDLEVLDAGERIRYAGYRDAADRRRFLAGRALLRRVAAGYLGVLPQRVPLTAHCPDCCRPHGRPALPGSGIEVSIAHSGDRVAVAATRAGPVGIDVEFIDPLMGVNDLIPRVLAPEERQFPSLGTPARFYRMWTRKEAVLKATGDGLRVPLSHVAVSAPDASPRLIRLPGVRARAEDFVLTDLEVPTGYVAAAAVISSGPVRFIGRDGSQLLAAATRPACRRPNPESGRAGPGGPAPDPAGVGPDRARRPRR